ncbi:MAG: glycosyltransferase [Acetobacteraceae bacterium]|nr:glycosyltransferase [Acetobacteraceae bacterium]
MTAPPMRLLLLSYWFPPTNAVGAVRTGKFAKYLREAGHEVRVVAGPRAAPLTLPLEIPEALVSRPAADPAPSPARPSAAAPVSGLLGAGRSRAAEALRRHWYAARHVPDKQAAWVAQAVKLGRALLREWRPDLIVASAPPYSGLMAAARLSAESTVPWVAELRDPWSGNAYNDRPVWRDRLDRIMERRTLRSASALVAVSPVVARELKASYHHQPVRTIFNGYALEDMPPSHAPGPHQALSIVYTGTLYEGRRDPSPLFAAIARLPEAARQRVRVSFYGPSESQVHSLAARHDVLEQVAVMPSVTYQESLAIQARADILLLLQRNHPEDEGNLPAKVFEYLGALRPILLLGYPKGELAGLIRERGAGVISNEPAIIAAQLVNWLARLSAGGIPALPETARAGLSRAEQFIHYEALLRDHALTRPTTLPAPPQGGGLTDAPTAGGKQPEGGALAQPPRRVLDELPSRPP